MKFVVIATIFMSSNNAIGIVHDTQTFSTRAACNKAAEQTYKDYKARLSHMTRPYHHVEATCGVLERDAALLFR